MVDSIEANVMKHLIFRIRVTSSLFLGYSTLVLGNSVSPNAMYNALAAAGSAVTAETGVRYLMSHINHAKIQRIKLWSHHSRQLPSRRLPLESFTLSCSRAFSRPSPAA